jgi:hypothetical protein
MVDEWDWSDGMRPLWRGTEPPANVQAIARRLSSRLEDLFKILAGLDEDEEEDAGVLLELERDLAHIRVPVYADPERWLGSAPIWPQDVYDYLDDPIGWCIDMARAAAREQLVIAPISIQYWMEDNYRDDIYGDDDE